MVVKIEKYYLVVGIWSAATYYINGFDDVGSRRLAKCDRVAWQYRIFAIVMDEAHKPASTKQYPPCEYRVSRAELQLVVIQTGQVWSRIVHVEYRLMTTYVGSIACIIHHQHASVGRRRSLGKLMQTYCRRQFEMSAVTLAHHSLHEFGIQLAC